MNFAQGDEGGLVFGQDKHLVAIGDLGGAGHHDPVLGSVMVLLQAEAGLWLDLNAFNLKSTALVDAVVPAPGAVHFAVKGVCHRCDATRSPKGFLSTALAYRYRQTVDEVHL